MIIAALAFAALFLAAIPGLLFVLNLMAYRRLAPFPVLSETTVSVLIPTRNEQDNIRETLEAVLANSGCRYEVIVLDDHSTDLTAQIVGEIAQRDPRVRLELAPPLPPDWCGKQHACYILGKLACSPLLVFMDADVRLERDALVRMGAFMRQTGAALASGVPHQRVNSFSERLLIPLIHFILLGFLPMHLMRRTRWPSMSAGCGQLFIARRDAYEACGGHSMLRASLHDGIKLPRVFRRAGLKTELFDATDIASCRMYRTGAETWRGLGKNATEGLAAPGTIIPMSVLLFGGQVLPYALLAASPWLPAASLWLAVPAAILAYLPRLLAAYRFRQPFWSTLLHPVAVIALLLIQWTALIRSLRGRPSEWRGRHYASSLRVKAVEPA